MVFTQDKALGTDKGNRKETSNNNGFLLSIVNESMTLLVLFIDRDIGVLKATSSSKKGHRSMSNNSQKLPS